MSRAARTSLPEGAAVAALGLATALLLWHALPPTPIAFNDDFGYFRSVAETLRRGRPWTDDWLGPWAASLSTLSASIFALTGSFRAATYGLDAALAGAIVVLGVLLLRRRDVPLPAAALWVLVFLSFPTLTWKLAEFGAVPLYVACLLAALCFAERGRWALFAACWLIALASRQSAVVWLALPAGALVETASTPSRDRRKIVAQILAIGAAGALSFLALGHAMNRSYAQAWQDASVRDHLSAASFLGHFALTLALFLAAAGVGAFVLATARGHGAERPSRAARATAALGGAAVVLLLLLDARRYVALEHPQLAQPRGTACLTVLAVLAIAGWLWAAPAIRLRYLAGGVAAAVLMGLVPTLWDYYLIDAVVFGLAGVTLRPARERRGSARLARAACYAAAATLLWIESGFVRATKASLDLDYAKVSLYERALRAGEIGPAELTSAPFGFIGWHLFPYFVANDGAGRPISAFQRYVRRHATSCRVDAPHDPPPSVADGRLRRDDEVMLSDVFPLGWQGTARVTLIRERSRPGTPLMTIDPGRYIFAPFPLSDEEWRQAVRDESGAGRTSTPDRPRAVE